MTARYITINDKTGSFLDVDAIEGIIDGVSAQADEQYLSVILTISGRYGSPMTPLELRGRIESVLKLSTN